MNRREFGSAVALLGLVGTAGCLGSQAGETSRTEATTSANTTSNSSPQTVSVTKRVKSGQTGLIRVVQIQDGGKIKIELTCPDGTTRSATSQLSAQDWEEFKQLILETDLAAVQSTYECESQCPSDIPPTQLTITVNDHVTETHIEAGADHPESLRSVLSHLSAFVDSVDAPTCTEDR